ncbi:MAG TPA: hypothetical protein VF411_03095 [Bacteroidia bacterium]
MKKLVILSLTALIAVASCKKDTKSTTTTPPPAPPALKFVFKFDSTQARLGDSGQVVTLPSTHRAQNPHFNGMSAHYIELSKTPTTQVGSGAVLYVTTTQASSALTVTNTAGSQTYTNAIVFSEENIVGQGGQFFSIPLSSVPPGTYPYLRISVAYQNYDINYGILQGTAVSGYTLASNYYTTGTIASFIGYNSYINSYKIKNQTVSVGTNKAQGYWGFESAPYVLGGNTYTVAPSQGQAPQGATTVVNPLFASSAIPAGSCLVTGRFVGPTGARDSLIITGHETSDIVITVSMSTNNSFEWKHNPANPSDNNIYFLNGDTVVNMGVRGMKPILPN